MIVVIQSEGSVQLLLQLQSRSTEHDLRQHCHWHIQNYGSSENWGEFVLFIVTGIISVKWLLANEVCLFQVLVTLLVLLVSEISCCNEHAPLLPPCPSMTRYSTEQCTVTDPVTNITRQQTQCVKVEPNSIYESWQFWIPIMIILLAICMLYNYSTCSCILVKVEWQILLACLVIIVVVWKWSRYTQCYQNLTYELRHEKNRVCARFCVQYCCVCKSCVKCCEPYTRPTTSELHRNQGDGSISSCNV